MDFEPTAQAALDRHPEGVEAYLMDLDGLILTKGQATVWPHPYEATLTVPDKKIWDTPPQNETILVVCGAEKRRYIVLRVRPIEPKEGVHQVALMLKR